MFMSDFCLNIPSWSAVYENIGIFCIVKKLLLNAMQLILKKICN